jgi:hypothetical protein
VAAAAGVCTFQFGHAGSCLAWPFNHAWTWETFHIAKEEESSMKHPVRYLPLALAAFALHANAQSFSPAWDEYRNKEKAAEASAQGQQPAQPQPSAPQTSATPPQASPYAAPPASRAPDRDQGGFFVGVQGGRGWIYDDIEQRATAVNAGYRWQTGPWAQVGVEISGGRLDETREDGFLIPEATYTAVGANARLNFGDSRWFAVVRGGYFNADQDGPYGDFSTDGGYAGLGIGVDINRHFNISLAYNAYVYADDYYYDDCDDYDDCEFNRADTVMLGIEARF